MAVGPTYLADGNIPASARYSKDSSSVVNQSHGKYFEAASRGALFCAGDQGVGVAVQVTLTTVATLALWNPVTSLKRLAIKKVAISYFSGTLGAGSFYHGFNPVGTVLPSSGTSLTANCLGIGNASGPPAVGVAITGATVVAGKVLYPFASSLPILATTAVAPFAIIEDVDGAIVLEPGAVYQLLGVFGAAGTTPKVSVGIVWEEVPYVATTG
jgi:hypothetical protein